jgi:hypothetical protein
LLANTAVGNSSLSSGRSEKNEAVQNTPWKGFYAGGNIGGAWNHTCSSWEPGPTITGTPGLASASYNRDCPNNGSFIGGIDFGYNMQIDQWVFGFKADYDAVESKTKSKSIVVAKGAPTYFPAGGAQTPGIRKALHTQSTPLLPFSILNLGPLSSACLCHEVGRDLTATR